MALRPAVVRGNASEVLAIAGAMGAISKGVDTTAEPEAALDAAKQLARQYSCVMAISGATDLVSKLGSAPPSC